MWAGNRRSQYAQQAQLICTSSRLLSRMLTGPLPDHKACCECRPSEHQTLQRHAAHLLHQPSTLRRPLQASSDLPCSTPGPMMPLWPLSRREASRLTASVACLHLPLLLSAALRAVSVWSAGRPQPVWCWCPVATCVPAQAVLPCCSTQTAPCAAARCRLA